MTKEPRVAGCRLGFDNSELKGGEYRGEGIARMLRNTRAQLEKDGYIGFREDEKEPHIYFHYTEKQLKHMTDGDAPFVSNMMEEDKDFDLITCSGFGVNEKGWTERCAGCPYLETNKPDQENSVPV